MNIVKRTVYLILFIILSIPSLYAETQITEGVYFSSMTISGPNNIFIVKLDRAYIDRYKFQNGMSAGNVYHNREYTSSIFSRYDKPGNNVIAAVNAGFFESDGEARGGIIYEGNVIQDFETFNTRMASFGQLFDGTPVINKVTNKSLKLTLPDATTHFDRINNDRGAGQLILYTPEWYSTTKTANTPSVEVVLKNVSFPLSPGKEQACTVSAVYNSTNTVIPKTGLVISGHKNSATLLSGLKAGDTVKILLELSDPVWNNVRGAATGLGWLVHNSVANTSAWGTGGIYDYANPRTVIGFNDQYIYMVLIDGRTTASVGMTFTQMASFLINTLNCKEAMNFDGGGSACMVVNGVVVNHPSGGVERSVGNAMMLVEIPVKEQIPPEGWTNFVSLNSDNTAVQENDIVDITNPICKIDVKDTDSGINPQSAYYKYSNDGGATWPQTWLTAVCTNLAGTTSYFTITSSVQFTTTSLVNNRIKFKVSDNAGNYDESREYTVRIATYNIIDTVPPSNPTTCYSWSSSSKTFQVVDNIWQNACDKPYFEWTGASDNQSGILGYSVCFSTNPGEVPTTEITQPNNTALNHYTVKESISGGETSYLIVRTCDGTMNWSTAKVLFTTKYDDVPPNPVTQLILRPGLDNVMLTWSTPEDNVSSIKYYNVYRTTIEIDLYGVLTGTTSNNYYLDYSAIVNTTYYYRIEPVDYAGNPQANGDTVESIHYTIPNGIQPPLLCRGWASINKIIELNFDTWQNITFLPYFEWSGAFDTQNSISGYSVYWGKDPEADPGTQTYQSDNKYSVTVFDALNPAEFEGIYYLRLRTRNGLGEWTSPSTMFIFKYDKTPPGAVTKSALTTENCGVTLTWDNAEDTLSGTNGYKILRSTDIMILSSLIETLTQKVTTYSDLTVSVGTTYYYQLQAIDAAGNTQTTGNVIKGIFVTTNTIGSSELTITLSNAGGEVINIPGNDIKINAVFTGSSVPCSSKLYYRIKVNTGQPENWSSLYTRELQKVDSTNYNGVIPKNVITDKTAGIEYYVSAYDTSGIIYLSNATTIAFELTKSALIRNNLGGIITLIDGNTSDGNARLLLPAGALDEDTILTFGMTGINTVPQLKNNDFVDTSYSDRCVAVYTVTPSGTGLNSYATLTLLYYDTNNDGMEDTRSIPEDKLGVFWYDDNLAEWRYLGGKIDTQQNTLTVPVGHFSSFAVFAVNLNNISASAFKPRERIVTPNSDGKNDAAIFNGIHNYYALALEDDKTTGVKIYTLTGKLVCELKDTDTWQGTDTENNFLENGVYIYQYTVNGQMVSGTIVIAK